MSGWKEIAVFVGCSLRQVQSWEKSEGFPQPRTITIPFESHSGLIFLRTTLDKKPALLLLDTGANVSIVFKDGARIIISDGAFHTLSEYPERTVFRYPDELHRAKGLVGEDILREFFAVRIDYKKQVLELVR